MPNLCYYQMRVQGKPEDVEYVVQTMQAKYNYDTMEFSHEKHLYRVFDACINDDTTENGIRDVIISSGDCAWSVAS